VNQALRFDTEGVELFKNLAGQPLMEKLQVAFSALEFRGGSRQFELKPFLSELFGHDAPFSCVMAKLGVPDARPVRVLAFDKTPQSNWSLGWHQDRVVALKEKRDVHGFVNWTVKSGIHHVQAPLELLQQMFSLRLHIDDCPSDNGALRVSPASYQNGLIEEAQIPAVLSKHGERVCEAKSGDILAMKALTLHASSPSLKPSHRRVLHCDFCQMSLPSGLDWALEPFGFPK
jgi:hypothetical protein